MLHFSQKLYFRTCILIYQAEKVVPQTKRQNWQHKGSNQANRVSCNPSENNQSQVIKVPRSDIYPGFHQL